MIPLMPVTPPTPAILALARGDHFTPGRRSLITTVILHATAGSNSLAHLQWASTPPVSCHVLVTKLGNRLRIVNDDDTAWHAGYGMVALAGRAPVDLNACSLGLELENFNTPDDPYPDAQLHAAAVQLAEWELRHGTLRWYRHMHVDARKLDPMYLNVNNLRHMTSLWFARLYGSRVTSK